MLFILQTRAKARVLAGVALVCAGLGVAVGAVWLAGGPAHAAASTSLRAVMPVTLVVAAPAPVTAPGAAATSAPVALAPSPAMAPAVEHASARDLDCLAAAIYYEARGESADGQAAVAQVVLNRARHPAFPKTVCGVVYQGAAPRACQFSFVCNGAMRRPREPGAWAKAKTVAARALSGYVMAQVGQATSFHAAHGGSRLTGMTRMTRVGGQVFYRADARGPARAWRHSEFALDAHAHGVDAEATLIEAAGSAGAALRPALPNARGHAPAARQAVVASSRS